MAGLLAWITTAWALDPLHPATRAERQGAAGPDSHIEVYRAGAQSIRLEPIGVLSSPARLTSQLDGWLLPSDGQTPAFKNADCRQIAHVLRMLCSLQETAAAADEGLSIVGTYVSMATAIEGNTTYATTRDSFDAAAALAQFGDWYLVDSMTGELVVRTGDLATAGRLHTGGSLAHGWLDGRMAAAGWERRTLQGWAEMGRDGRRGQHHRCEVYRGHMTSVSVAAEGEETP